MKSYNTISQIMVSTSSTNASYFLLSFTLHLRFSSPQLYEIILNGEIILMFVFYKNLKSDIKCVTRLFFFFFYFYLWKLIQESLFNYNEKLSKRVLCSFAKHLQSSLWNYQWLEIFDPKLSALNHSTTDSLVF